MEKLINDPDRVWHFLKDLGVPVMYSAGMQGIGREIDGGLVGGVLYEGWTKRNIFMHCAGSRGWRYFFVLGPNAQAFRAFLMKECIQAAATRKSQPE